MMPVMGRGRAGVDPAARRRPARLLADRCVDGLEADVERCRELAESSPSIVTPLNRVIGYEAAAKVAKKAVAERTTIRQAVLDLGYVERGEITERAARRGARRAGHDPAGPLIEGTGRVVRAGAQYQPVAWLCAQAAHGEP